MPRTWNCNLTGGLLGGSVEAAADTEPPPVAPRQLMIEIDGNGIYTDGLVISGGGSTVRGLAINRFDGNGLVLNGTGGNKVMCNVIGLNTLATYDAGDLRGNGGAGLLIDNVGGNQIGAIAAGEMARNVIAANGGSGIQIQGAAAQNNTIYDNFIGVDATGQVDAGNGGPGIFVTAGATATIGKLDGSEVDSSPLINVVGGNGGDGIRVEGGVASVVGNLVGIDRLGTSPLGNDGNGIALVGVTGGDVMTNVVAGNLASGIFITGSIGLQLQGNYVGTDLYRIGDLGNGRDGVELVDTMTTTIAANAIVFNGEIGVSVVGPNSTGNRIDGNSLYGHGGLGIDLERNGITSNDGGDGDTGPNQLQNFPEGLDYSVTDSSTTVSGTFTGGAGFKLQFFVNAACDPSGFGEGQVMLGEGDSTGSSDFSFDFVDRYVPDGYFLTAVAIDEDGNTSEFSPCGPTPAAPAVELVALADSASALPGATVTYELTVTNRGNTADSFRISVASQWPAQPSILQTQQLAIAESETFSVTVTVPTPMGVDEWNVSTVTAASAIDRWTTATAELTTTAEGFRDVEIIPAAQSAAVRPGETIVYHFQVLNTGNITDDYSMTAAGDWVTLVEAENLSGVTMGETRSVSVTVTVAEVTDFGAFDTATVEVTSTTDASVYASAIANTTVTGADLTLVADPEGITAEPGATATYSLTVVNTGTQTDTFTLEAAGSWIATLSASSTCELAPAATTMLYLDVEVPANATAEDNDETTILATSTNDPEVVETAVVRTTVAQVFGVLLEPEDQGGAARHDATFTYVFTATNTGNGTDSYTVDADGDWYVSHLPEEIVDLPRNGQKLIEVTVRVPDDAARGELGTTVITLTSQSASDASAIATAKTRVIMGGPRVEVHPPNAEVPPGDEATYTVTVFNDGTDPDEFAIDMSSLWPQTQTAMSTGVLAPGESRTFTVQTTVPEGTLAGSLDTANVTVISSNDPAQTASELMTTTAAPTTGVQLSHSPLIETIMPAQKAVFHVIVTNMGNHVDSFQLLGSGPWPFNFSEDALYDMAPGETCEVTVEVIAPEDALGGTVETHAAFCRLAERRRRGQQRGTDPLCRQDSSADHGAPCWCADGGAGWTSGLLDRVDKRWEQC